MTLAVCGAEPHTRSIESAVAARDEASPSARPWPDPAARAVLSRRRRSSLISAPSGDRGRADTLFELASEAFPGELVERGGAQHRGRTRRAAQSTTVVTGWPRAARCDTAPPRRAGRPEGQGSALRLTHRISIKAPRCWGGREAAYALKARACSRCSTTTSMRPRCEAGSGLTRESLGLSGAMNRSR